MKKIIFSLFLLRLFILRLFILPMLLLITAGQVFAQSEGVVVLSDTVTGNQEQPKVLYIVPWQPADDTTILTQPLTTKLHRDVFAHIERPEHVRELQYLEQLTPEK